MNTRQARLALFGCLTVLCVVTSVFGILKLNGAELTMNNLIGSTIVIGFSFDYALHMCCCYMASSGTPTERVVESISHLWVTLIGSAFTTSASLCTMLIPSVPFFNTMANMLILTAALSLLYSLFFLSSLNIVCGPRVSSRALSTFEQAE